MRQVGVFKNGQFIGNAPGPQGGVPAGEQLTSPDYYPTLSEPQAQMERGHDMHLDISDNDLVAGALFANVANAYSEIWAHQVPQGLKYHFRPQFMQTVDQNVPSSLLLLFDSTTTTNFVTGKFIIKIKTADEMIDIHNIMAGNLIRFGRGANVTAGISDHRLRQYANVQAWATQGNWISLQIQATTVISTTESEVYIGMTRYNR